MNFKVTFTSKNAWNPAINIASKEIGLSGVRTVRTLLGLPELDIDVIEGYSDEYKKNKTITISENFASDSGLFENKNGIVVVVPEGFLNRFCKENVSFSNDENGKVEKAELGYVLDENMLMEYWIENEFPVKIEE